MKNKNALAKLLGFMPRLKRPVRPKRLTNTSADPTEHTFKSDELQEIMVDAKLEVNVKIMQAIMAGNSDFVLRKFNFGPQSAIPAAVAYIDGLADSDMIHETILAPMMGNRDTISFDQVENVLVTAGDVQQAEDYKAIIESMLAGGVVLFVQGHAKALLAGLAGFKERSISEPVSEGLVRGPREGFTENLRTNTALVRRRIKSPNLVFEDFNLGRVSDTKLVIAYVRGLCDPDLVEEVKKRLSRIEIDGVLESGYIEELIEDNPYSPFPQVQHSERPDRVAAALLDGRVAIFTDNTPFVLFVPGEFVTYIQTAEDYFERYWLASAVRLLRYFALAMSLLLPSFYIAVTTFHQEMIPTPLLIGIAASREGVPFPALLEALFMEISFEALREAGLRLPRPVGQAVSIVGALVVGDAAVTAGIVSPIMVIVVALTGIASFANPSFSMSISLRLLRFPFMILAGTLGLFGVMAGLLVMLVHLSALRSFGVPYLSPYAPFCKAGMEDALIRAPWWALRNRPQDLSKGNRHRMTPDLKPGPGRKDQPEEEATKQDQNSLRSLDQQQDSHMAQEGEDDELQGENKNDAQSKRRKRCTRRSHKKK